MLFVTCVLSVVAVMFVEDFSTFTNNNAHHGSRQNAAHQIDGTSGIPARQQTVITSQTIRAILTEANWLKSQSVYPSGGDKALLGELTQLELSSASQTPVFLAPYIITSLRTSHTSARAPPHAI